MELGDEGPGVGGEALSFVVTLDVMDAGERGALVETKAFVVAFRPDRMARAKTIADGVFRAFGDAADVVVRGADDDVNVPGADVQSVDIHREAAYERRADERANFEKLIACEEVWGVLHSRSVDGFEIGVGRQNLAVVDPAAAIATEPCAVRRHRQHRGEGLSHAADGNESACEKELPAKRN